MILGRPVCHRDYENMTRHHPAIAHSPVVYFPLAQRERMPANSVGMGDRCALHKLHPPQQCNRLAMSQ
ncbi:protein of unknown function (plasmid) [Cupriavidus taiwanensis]|nr:protein of unknown function [Cupriavidus taiwanensis]